MAKKTRAEMERQYEIDRITWEYVEAAHSGRAPRAEDLLARYPVYEDELRDFIAYYQSGDYERLVAMDAEAAKEPMPQELSLVGERVMAEIRRRCSNEQRAKMGLKPLPKDRDIIIQ